MNDKIPKVIHYCWFGKKSLPELAKMCIASWKKMCPDYEIIEWNESNFDINMNNYIREAYSLKKYAFVSDYCRLYVVYNFGGIYLDTDVELLKNLDQFLNHESFFGTEDNKLISTGLGFGACKKNMLIKKMMEDYEKCNFILSNGNIDCQACPLKNSKSIKEILEKFEDISKIRIYKNNYFYPKEFFCPIDNISGEIKLTEDTVSIHHYSASWLSDKEKKMQLRKHKICKIFGIKIGKKIVKIYTLPYRINKKIKMLGIKKTLKFIAYKFRKK